MSPSLAIFLQFLLFASLVWAQTPSPSLESSSSISSAVSTTANSTSGTPSRTSSAAFPTLSGYSSCVVSCLSLSVAQTNCTSQVDVNCFCPHPRFAPALVACVTATCPSELLLAEGLAQRFCALATTSTSLEFPTPTVEISSFATSTPVAPTTSAPASTTSATRNGARRDELGWTIIRMMICVVAIVLL